MILCIGAQLHSPKNDVPHGFFRPNMRSWAKKMQLFSGEKRKLYYIIFGRKEEGHKITAYLKNRHSGMPFAVSI